MTRRVVSGVGQWEAEPNRHVFLGELVFEVVGGRQETTSRGNNVQWS